MAEEFIGLDSNPIETTTGVVESTEVTVEPHSEVETKEEAPKVPTPTNKITVHVLDNKAPILLLFGAPSSGKTMTLVRLAKYLRKQGYSIETVPTFCNDAWEYAENVERFNGMLQTTEALPGTGRNDFLFIKISDGRGKTICQILEGAGEDYFPSKVAQGANRAQHPFPPYMTGIFNKNNKKIWMFLTEPNWKVKYQDKDDYVNRIRYCKSQFFSSSKDQCIILYNKVDTTPFVYGQGQVYVENAMSACNDEYPGLFDIFKNKSALAFFQNKYTCKFVPFSTGAYGQAAPNQPAHYDPSHDKYPHALWKTIMDCIEG